MPRDDVFLRPLDLRAVVFLRPVLFRAVIFFFAVERRAVVLRPVVRRAVVFLRPVDARRVPPPRRIPPLISSPLIGVGAGGGVCAGCGLGHTDPGCCCSLGQPGPRFSSFMLPPPFLPFVVALPRWITRSLRRRKRAC